MNIEDVFTQISLDVLGQAVFEHDFDALSKEDEFFKASEVLTGTCEMVPINYWGFKWLFGQNFLRRCLSITGGFKWVLAMTF